MIDKITNHFQLALDRRLEQYKDKPEFEKIIKVYSKQIQELEDALFQILKIIQFIKFVTFATDTYAILTNEEDLPIVCMDGPNIDGVNLDIIGRFLEVSRNGLSDNEFYYKILNKIDIINANGRIPLIIKVFKYLVGSDEVQYIADYPAGFYLTVVDPDFCDEQSVICNLMLQAMPAGVGITILKTETPFFEFTDLQNSSTPGGEGFSAIGTGDGGYFSEIYYPPPIP